MRTNCKLLNQYTFIFIDSGWITTKKQWNRTILEVKEELKIKFDSKNPYLLCRSGHLSSIYWIISINISRKRLSKRGKPYDNRHNKFEPFKKRFKINGEQSQPMKPQWKWKNRILVFRLVVKRTLGIKLESSSWYVVNFFILRISWKLGSFCSLCSFGNFHNFRRVRNFGGYFALKCNSRINIIYVYAFQPLRCN